MINIVGKTLDGKYTVSGVFRLYETYGLPLDIIIEILYKDNLIPAWDYFYMEATQAGLSHNKIILRVEQLVQYLKDLERFV